MEKFLLSLVFLLFSLSGKTQNPYYLENQTLYPEVVLPNDLRIEGINGRIIAGLKLNKDAEIVDLEWVVVLLKDKNGNPFIDYREAVSRVFTLHDYPKPIRPYYELIVDEVKKLKFVRDENVPKPNGDWWYRVSFIVK